MKILAITQARTSSTRLPNKVLLEIGTQNLLDVHICRILASKQISQLLVATTTNESDNVIADIANRHGVDHYRGSEHDVLDRFYQAALPIKPDYVVRLTSDCPLIDAELLDQVIRVATEGNFDYFSNAITDTYPDGQDVEVFTFDALQDAHINAKLDSEREHVTAYIRKQPNHKIGELTCPHDGYSSVRLTVDELVDFKVVSKLVEMLGTNEPWKVYADLYLRHPELQQLNGLIQRNEGYLKSIEKDRTSDE